MWLYFFHKVRWAMIPLTLFMIVAGIVMLVRDVGDLIGWALIFFGLLQCVLQYSFGITLKKPTPSIRSCNPRSFLDKYLGVATLNSSISTELASVAGSILENGNSGRQTKLQNPAKRK